MTKVYNTTTKKTLEKVINTGLQLYEEEGKRQSLGEFFGNYVIANKATIEGLLKK